VLIEWFARPGVPAQGRHEARVEDYVRDFPELANDSAVMVTW